MKKVRLGIIGLGNMGSGHFYNVFGGKCPSVEVAAVCDINPEKLEEALNKLIERHESLRTRFLDIVQHQKFL